MHFQRHVMLGIVASLSIISIAVAWRFLTVKYPTHSDVFFMGVEAGALAVLLFACVSLIGYFLYRFTVTRSHR